MDYKRIISKVSEDVGIPEKLVDKIYKSFWFFVKSSIQELPLKKDLTKEEFLLLRTNFNIPSLGKFTCTYDRYSGVKARFNYIKTLRNRHEEAD